MIDVFYWLRDTLIIILVTFRLLFISNILSHRDGISVFVGVIDIYLSGLLARRQNAWSQDDGNMRVIANGVNR